MNPEDQVKLTSKQNGMGGEQVVQETKETDLVLLLDVHPTALLGKEINRDGKGVGVLAWLQ